jgi:hypothetical protein
MNGAVDGAAGSGGAAGRLRAALVDYLTLRRALGFALRRDEKLLIQFLTYLEDHGKDTVTVADALAWASLPVGASPAWLGFRMGVVRGFAGYLHALDRASWSRRAACCPAPHVERCPTSTPTPTSPR